MACGSCGGGGQRNGLSPVPTVTSAARGSKTLYQVVLKGGDGPVAFQTNNVDLARRVSGNYPGSVLRPDPDASTAETVTEDPSVGVLMVAEDTDGRIVLADDVTVTPKKTRARSTEAVTEES